MKNKKKYLKMSLGLNILSDQKKKEEDLPTYPFCQQTKIFLWMASSYYHGQISTEVKLVINYIQCLKKNILHYSFFFQVVAGLHSVNVR